MRISKPWSLTLGVLLIVYAIYNLSTLNYSVLKNNREIYTPEKQSTEAQQILNDTKLIPVTSIGKNDIYVPGKIIIPAINLVAPIESANAIPIDVDGNPYSQFMVPEKYAAGWHVHSAPLGQPGNTVVSGHHNAYGKVFENLHKLKVGDHIYLISQGYIFEYIATDLIIMPEAEVDLDTKIENARWIKSTKDERLTLVTCWPVDSNTHRLVVVAVPVENQTRTSFNDKDSTCQEEIRSIHNLIFEIEHLFSEELLENDVLYGNNPILESLGSLSGLKNTVESICTAQAIQLALQYANALQLAYLFDINELESQYIGISNKHKNVIRDLYYTEVDHLAGIYSEDIEITSDSVNTNQLQPKGLSRKTNDSFYLAYNPEYRSINIRSSPSLKAPVIDSFVSYTSLPILGISSDQEWLLIVSNRKHGWISIDFPILSLAKEKIPVVPDILFRQ